MSRRDYNRSKNEDLGCAIVVLIILVFIGFIWFS